MAFAIGGKDNFGNTIDGPDSLAWANAHPNEPEPQGLSSGNSAAMDAMLEAQAEANEIAAQQLEISRRQAEISEERYDYWKQNIWPMQQELIGQAKAGLDIGYAANRAASDMAINMQKARASQAREMQRIGIDPNNPRYQGILKNYDLYRQAAVAGAANRARLTTDQANRNMRLQVAGMGAGVPMQSLSAFNAASEGLSAAAVPRLSGAQGLASAYNVGAANRLNTEQFNAEMQSRANQLDFGQQTLAAQQRMFESDLSTQRQLWEDQQEQRMWGAVGGLAGMALGAGIGYMTSPNMAKIGGSAIGTSAGASTYGGGAVSSAWPSLATTGGSAISTGYNYGQRPGGYYGL